MVAVLILLKIAGIAVITGFGWILYRRFELKAGLWWGAFMGLSLSTGLLMPRLMAIVVDSVKRVPPSALPSGFETFEMALGTLSSAPAFPGALAGLVITLLVIGDGVRLLDRLETPGVPPILRRFAPMSDSANTWGILSICLLLTGPLCMYLLGLHFEGLAADTSVGPPW